MKKCYSTAYIEETQQRLRKFRSTPGQEAMAAEIIRRLRAQMFDISAYMHIVQRRFSAWFNERHERRGTLWQGRFRSTLVEDSGDALLKTSAYIDLNAVRAKIIKDPKDYRWCGYAEAVAGRVDAQEGVAAVVRAASNSEVSESAAPHDTIQLYRDWLIEFGAPLVNESGDEVRAGFKPGVAGGKLTQKALLSSRVRYFTASLAIGSRSFCDELFQRYRNQFGPNRQSGARPWRQGAWGGLCGLRDLRKDIIGMGS